MPTISDTDQVKYVFRSMQMKKLWSGILENQEEKLISLMKQ